MTGLGGWMAVLGPALAVGCVYVVAGQVVQDLRAAAKTILQSNGRALAGMGQLADSSMRAPAGVTLPAISPHSPQATSPPAC